MTIVVGILCGDGVVMASDSAATFAESGNPTIGQQEVRKILKLNDSILYSSSGAVGISQIIAHEIKSGWDKNQYGSAPPEEVMDKIGKRISELVAPYLHSANMVRPLVGDASMSLCKSIVSMPVKRVPCLFNFDYNGAPERSTRELPFVSIGSGQRIADPFLALLKRLLWKDAQPTLSEGRLAAVWTIDHVRLTNPGGVGGAIQLATLSAKDGKQPTVTIFPENDVQEHLQHIRLAEKALYDEIHIKKEDAKDIPIPEAPKNA